ncbi:hypothetical protein E4U53_003639 [Claviceps sorghi]|nr:hypothetical protein E4U53_003639 [Claviceps sorghi]
MRRNTRFVSDSLYFTGIDLGDRSGGTYRRRHYSDSDNEDGYRDWKAAESESEEDGEDEDYGGGGEGGDEDEDEDANGYLARLSPEHREEMSLRSALRLISRAQAMGETDVHLNKQELEAYGRYLQRMEEEERARQKKKKTRNKSSGSEKKKVKEQRMAVPLTQLAPTSRKKKSSLASWTEFPPRQDSLPRERSATDLAPDGHDRKGYPPMGYFPPPSSASRSRPRSGTTTSQPLSASRPQSSRDSPRDEASTMSSRSQINMNPFQFQTAGPRVPYPPGAAAASRRPVPGPTDVTYERHGETGASATARSRHGSRRASYDEFTSEEGSPTSEESTSDDRGNGAKIREPVGKAGRRGRDEVIVVEESPERTRSKKKSSSPVKRKPVGGRKKKK